MIITEVREWDMLADKTLNEVFSIVAIEKLYEIFDEYSEACENKIWKYDPVAIRCEWREESPSIIRSDYGIDESYSVIEYLEEHTVAHKLSNGNILFAEF